MYTHVYNKRHSPLKRGIGTHPTSSAIFPSVAMARNREDEHAEASDPGGANIVAKRPRQEEGVEDGAADAKKAKINQK